jgi:hypothetical protein
LVAGLWDGEDLGGNDEMDTTDAMTKDVLVDGIIRAVSRILVGLTMRSVEIILTDRLNHRDLRPPSRLLRLPTERSQNFRPQAATPLLTGTRNDPFRSATRTVTMTRQMTHLRPKGFPIVQRPN